MALSSQEKDDALKRLGAFAGMLEDCSALVLLHVNEAGVCTFHRCGNLYAQAGAARVFEVGIRQALVESDWDPDGEE